MFQHSHPAANSTVFASQRYYTWASPRGCNHIRSCLAESEEQGRKVEFPTRIRILHNLFEEIVASLFVEKVVLIGRLFVTVTRRNHHAFDTQVHDRIKKLPNLGGMNPREESRVCGNAKTAADWLPDGGHGDIKRAITADGGIMMFSKSIQVNGKTEIFGRFEKIGFSLQEQGIGA